MEEKQENMPYTVVGHSGLNKPKLSILLTAEGIFELAKRMKNGEKVRIEQWEDVTNECENIKYYGKITILRN